MTTTDTTTIPTEHLRAVFDIAVHSLDFGSGFLDTDEVNHLRAVAESLGVDPLEGTPREFKSTYPHPFCGEWSEDDECMVSGGRCSKPAGDPIHVPETGSECHQCGDDPHRPDPAKEPAR